MQFPPGHFAFLDLETTGPKAGMDRILEVGLIEVLDGEVIDQYETLVNPGVPVSSFITSLTGIDNLMVAEAPQFSDIAEDLMARLLGRTLVAHNARFDHSFLKNEFRRIGLRYRTKVVCTVKLSRQLTPEIRSHSLDNLIRVHGLHVDARHRAMGDADLMVQLVSRWSRILGEPRVAGAVQDQLKGPALPPTLDAGAIEALPNGPGVYLFYDRNDTLLYVGKSVRIRDRVKSHFSGDHASDKELEMGRQVTRIDHHCTGGDLGAQLLEARLIKERSPVYNRQLRKTRTLWYLELQDDKQGYLTVRISRGTSPPLENLSNVAGLFRSRRMAEQALRRMADSAQLCHRLTGLEKSRRGPCFAHQLHRCAGACVGKESTDSYNERLERALDDLRFKAWPHDGPVVIEDQGEYHLIDRWCHLGSAERMEDLPAVRQPQRLEYDIYKILVKFLERDRKRVRLHSLNQAL